jgi:hypothetical protein
MPGEQIMMPMSDPVALRRGRAARCGTATVGGGALPGWRGAITVDDPLRALRRRLLDIEATAAFATDEMRDLAQLCALALRHIDGLRLRGMVSLPVRAGLFGRAHVTVRQLAYRHPGGAGTVKFLDLDSGRRVAPPPPEMHYGAAITADVGVTTEASGALLFFDDGSCAYVPPFHTGTVRRQGRPGFEPRRLDMAC